MVWNRLSHYRTVLKQAFDLIIFQMDPLVKKKRVFLRCWTASHAYASMGYMEISLVSANSIKLKGKHATLLINPQDKSATYNVAVLFGNPPKSSLKLHTDIVTIDGPGEYEAGGIKISGVKADGETAYSFRVDGVDLLLGSLANLEKVHQKMKEHHVALVAVETEGNSSFVSALATHALMFFGPQAQSVVDTLAKEEKKVTTKYSISADKLPGETETILLASSS